MTSYSSQTPNSEILNSKSLPSSQIQKSRPLSNCSITKSLNNSGTNTPQYSCLSSASTSRRPSIFGASPSVRNSIITFLSQFTNEEFTNLTSDLASTQAFINLISILPDSKISPSNRDKTNYLSKIFSFIQTELNINSPFSAEEIIAPSLNENRMKTLMSEYIQNVVYKLTERVLKTEPEQHNLNLRQLVQQLINRTLLMSKHQCHTDFLIHDLNKSVQDGIALTVFIQSFTGADRDLDTINRKSPEENVNWALSTVEKLLGIKAPFDANAVINANVNEEEMQLFLCEIFLVAHWRSHHPSIRGDLKLLHCAYNSNQSSFPSKETSQPNWFDSLKKCNKPEFSRTNSYRNLESSQLSHMPTVNETQEVLSTKIDEEAWSPRIRSAEEGDLQALEVGSLPVEKFAGAYDRKLEQIKNAYEERFHELQDQLKMSQKEKEELQKQLSDLKSKKYSRIKENEDDLSRETPPDLSRKWSITTDLTDAPNRETSLSFASNLSDAPNMRRMSSLDIPVVTHLDLLKDGKTQMPKSPKPSLERANSNELILKRIGSLSPQIKPSFQSPTFLRARSMTVPSPKMETPARTRSATLQVPTDVNSPLILGVNASLPPPTLNLG